MKFSSKSSFERGTTFPITTIWAKLELEMVSRTQTHSKFFPVNSNSKKSTRSTGLAVNSRTRFYLVFSVLRRFSANSDDISESLYSKL